MSDEPDPETLRERVRELEQTADDLRETVAELQQRRGPSRRDLLKVGTGGLLGAGLLASSQPVSAAPASSDTSVGQVGVAGDSEDIVLDQAYDPGGDEILNVDDSGGINAQFGRVWHFDDINLGSTLDLSGNDLTGVQSLDVEYSNVKSDGQEPSVPRDAPLLLRGSSDGAGLILQNQDDGQNLGPGRANIFWYSDAEARLAAIVSHPTDNHFSLYTKTDPVGDGDTGLSKRLDVPGGSTSTIVNWKNISRMQYKNPDGSMGLYLSPGTADTDAQIHFEDHNRTERMLLAWDGSSEEFIGFDDQNSLRWLRYRPGLDLRFDAPEITFTESNLVGLREVGSQPSASDLERQEWAFTKDRDGAGTASWLFKDSDGIAHYFNPDGTL